MAKFCGPVGYAIPIETVPGKWKDKIEEHNYRGDILSNNMRWESSSDSTNDDLNVNVQISIIADPFANNNFHSMKYVRFMGAYWKIKKVEPKYPRLILTIGGVYNGPTENSGRA